MVNPAASRNKAGGAAARISRAAGMATLILMLIVAFVCVTGGAGKSGGPPAAGLAQSKLVQASPPQARRTEEQAISRGGLATHQLAEEEEAASEGAEAAGEGAAAEGGERAEGGGEAKEEHEFNDEEKAVISRWGYAFVTIIIVFSVSFEYAVEVIQESVPEELSEVVTALLEELTTLGFLGFAFFMTTVPVSGGESLIEMLSMYSLHEKEALKELFEGLHYLVFFVSLSFILSTIGGLLTFRFTGDKG